MVEGWALAGSSTGRLRKMPVRDRLIRVTQTRDGSLFEIATRNCQCPRNTQSPEFRRFFEAVSPFVYDIEEMRHYQVTPASTG
jgi:hypothetical protein